MRQFLLLGTMLGMATTALAFGGVFNHGSKSTTYKGGVDAIGVHFGGEKKTADITADTPSCPEHSEWNGTACECKLGWMANESGECDCPEERRCGETCCGEGNVCHPEINVCCAEDYEDWGEDFMDVCCAAGSVGYAGESCCEIGEVIAGDGDEKHCCPTGSIGWGINPETGEEGCCPMGATYVSAYNECCGPNTPVYESSYGRTYCCPEGTTGFQDEPDSRCCTKDEIPVRSSQTDEDLWFCCPKGSTDWIEGECI